MIRLVTPPAASAVPLVEAKAHLRVDHDEDDALIAGLVDAATGHLDGWTGVLGRALMPQVWEMTLDRFPRSEIRLPLGPVASIVSISYDDSAGVEQVVESDQYRVDARGWPAPVSGAAWPSTAGAVRVRWTAGTGCPAPVKHAILLLVGHWYAAREAAGAALAEMPFGVAALIAPWRRVGI